MKFIHPELETNLQLDRDAIERIYYQSFSFLHNPAFTQKAELAYLPYSFISSGFNHPKYQIRAFIAANKNTPISYLRELVYDENWVVRKAVASNLVIPLELQKQLAKDSNCHVKLELIKRETISDSLRLKIIEDLATSRAVYIRKQVVLNQYTPQNILKQLSNDSDPDLKRIADLQILSRSFNLEFPNSN